jgi:short-subunit dehydrogenase
MLAQNTDCHIVNTASVAGLIAGHPSAPYSVTKHAVVALSENLHLTLQQRNALVKVSVLCPCIIATDIMSCERNRPIDLHNEPVEIPPEAQAALAFLNAAVEAGSSPVQCAAQVFEAIREERFYILTDPEWLTVVQSRVNNLLRLENPQDTMDVVINLCEPAG